MMLTWLNFLASFVCICMAVGFFATAITLHSDKELKLASKVSNIVQDAPILALKMGEPLKIRSFTKGEMIPTEYYRMSLRDDITLNEKAACPIPEDVRFGSKTTIAVIGDEIWFESEFPLIVIDSTAIECSFDFGRWNQWRE